MAVTQQKVLEAASVTLQDEQFNRWSPKVLATFLNAGQREIAIHKPNAVADDVEFALVEGTRQQLADNHIALLRVTRNLTAGEADPGGRRGGKAITAIERTAIDQFLPQWSDPDAVPYTTQADHIIYDQDDPRTFHVYPGNDGTGLIEARIAALPADMPMGETENDVTTYTATISLPDIYEQALIDYVLYRAFAMDMNIVGGAQRATFHYQQFAASIGLKLRGELSANPDSGNAVAQQGA